MISPNVNQERADAPLHDVDHRVVHRVLVLLKPPGHIVADRASIVHLGFEVIKQKLDPKNSPQQNERWGQFLTSAWQK